jgi:hypothetical protein
MSLDFGKIIGGLRVIGKRILLEPRPALKMLDHQDTDFCGAGGEGHGPLHLQIKFGLRNLLKLIARFGNKAAMIRLAFRKRHRDIFDVGGKLRNGLGNMADKSTVFAGKD